MIIVKKNSNFRKQISFCFISFNFCNVITATLKGSRNFQGFAVIRAVLFDLLLKSEIYHFALYMVCGGMNFT